MKLRQVKRAKGFFKKASVIAIATAGGAGFFPVAPGTAGSALAVVLLYFAGTMSVWLLTPILIALLLAGVWASGQANVYFREVDSGHIVIDEVVGLGITLLGIPINFYWLIIGFLVFRVLDILKPSPADYFNDKVKNGWGVMMDDVIAGIYGNLLLRLMMKAQF